MFHIRIFFMFLVVWASASSSPVPPEQHVHIPTVVGNSVGEDALLLPDLPSPKDLLSKLPPIIPIPIPIPVGPNILQKLPQLPELLKKIVDEITKKY
ncbi:hypothetical protein WA026_015017 [Henosepilachna vigintioctopunctata]|uniref:Uncharacterized protein n=1 Tax=Henosepilachna vigintioctopunctata TaxID=420089 RepID=A0AAW1U783_9CUCU